MSELIVSSDAGWNAERNYKAISDNIGETLATLYPGYHWRVEVGRGIVDVRCGQANSYCLKNGRRQNVGYTFNLVRDGIPDRAAIMRAGGEVLESFKLSRRGFDESAFRSLPRWCGQLLIAR